MARVEILLSRDGPRGLRRALRRVCAEHFKPALMRQAHFVSIDLGPGGRVTRRCLLFGRRLRREAFGQRRRCQPAFLLFERLEHPARVKPW